jgi:site-specific DNA-cytosine methylase
LRVLSLFDGMSCGRIALERAGIRVGKYFASEIDRPAIAISHKNYPDIARLGDVRGVAKEWPLRVDLIMGGSPCQSFSTLGDGSGFGGESKLFWEFVRVLEAVKPRYYLLENVPMKKEWADVITNALGGGQPIVVNSSVFSAQSRERMFWTNIPVPPLPERKPVHLGDILDKENWRRYIVTNKAELEFALNFREGFNRAIHGNPTGLCNTLVARIYASWAGPYLSVDHHTGELTQDWDRAIVRRITPLEAERLQTVPDHYTRGVSDRQAYRMLGNGWTVEVIAHILRGMG